METVARLLAALADAARADRKSEFDRLERELLTSFDGSFDAMPREIYERYLEVDRLWPVVPPPAGGDRSTTDATRRSSLHLSVGAENEAFLRQLGTEADRSLSAVLAACIEEIRSDPALAGEVVRKLGRHPASD